MSDHQADYPIATMCRLLGVSPSGYYAWRKRRPSHRTETDTALTAEIRAAHATSRGIYGAPRIHAELAAKGVHVGRKRVARLMSQAGLAGVSRRWRSSSPACARPGGRRRYGRQRGPRRPGSAAGGGRIRLRREVVATRVLPWSDLQYRNENGPAASEPRC